jgi:hypothetical protein
MQAREHKERCCGLINAERKVAAERADKAQLAALPPLPDPAELEEALPDGGPAGIVTPARWLCAEFQPFQSEILLWGRVFGYAAFAGFCVWLLA